MASTFSSVQTQNEEDRGAAKIREDERGFGGVHKAGRTVSSARKQQLTRRVTSRFAWVGVPTPDAVRYPTRPGNAPFYYAAPLHPLRASLFSFSLHSYATLILFSFPFSTRRESFLFSLPPLYIAFLPLLSHFSSAIILSIVLFRFFFIFFRASLPSLSSHAR